MKRKITLLLLAAGSLFTMNAQVLSEDFNATFVPSASGWTVQNLSNPVGTTSWFQGSSATFPAYNGAPGDYFAANYNSQGTTSGGISTWLITPSVSIYNGAVLQFATRTASVATPFPDRMQVRMSQNATNSVIPTGTASVGSFTDLLLDINPLLTTNNTSVVTNSTVNGYPQAWTVYTLVISNVTGTVSGRFAFRYFVDDGGINGNNSSYIGIDAVRYNTPCDQVIPSYTICAGASATLDVVGVPANTYSWSNGPTTSSNVVSPTSTTVYSLTVMNGSASCGAPKTGTITVGSQLSVMASASSATICNGSSVLLSANAAASSYAWTNGSSLLATTQTVLVSPTVTTTYSVGALSGACQGGGTVMVTVNALPTLSVDLSPACLGGSVTINASGATTYTYLGSNTNPQSIASPTAAGGYSFALGGTTNGCTSVGAVNFTVYANPTISVVSSTATACTNKTITITASGASTYSYSGAATGTTNPLSYATGTVAGTKTFTIEGVDAVSGCTATKVFTQNVVVCNTTTTSTVGIVSYSGYEETSIFPNPFTTELKINVLEGTAVVYNALGQAVISTAVHTSETINTADLPKGAYFVKAFNTNGELVKTVKLIKN